MTDTATLTIAPLALADAHELAPLLAAYTQDQKRGAPRAPDEYYAEILCNDRSAEVLGAREDGRLVGFAVFVDIPDTMTGLRAGQLNDIFVAHDARDRGVGTRLVDAVVAIGRERRWAHLRWMTPTRPTTASGLARKMSQEGPWDAYVLPIERAMPLAG